MRIGIGYTTHNRRALLEKSLGQTTKYLPAGAKLVVVDDASNMPYQTATYRYETNVGIARAKNKCLELLDDCDHILLFDDDTYPLTDGWEVPYIQSQQPHLMYQFKLPSKPVSDMRELHRDKDVVSYSHTRGAMLYIDREVLDVVGGMDVAYGRAMGEHTDWTNRIYNAGLTTHRAMDVPGSNKLLYCGDQDEKLESSISQATKARCSRDNAGLYHRSKSSKEYKEYK